MEPIRLMIVDTDDHFADTLFAYFRRFSNIEILCRERNGKDALCSIKEKHPDCVLFDLMLPGLDGISLLRNVNELKAPPAMICCTRFYSDVSLDALRLFGASYLLLKPIELHTLHTVISACAKLHRDLYRTLRSCSILETESAQHTAHIRNHIVSLGIPSKLIGCSYLAEAIRLAREDLSLTQNLSKGLYLEISRNMNTTPARIERSIRTAISAAFQNGSFNGRMITCPTNKEFINYVLRTLEL